MITTVTSNLLKMTCGSNRRQLDLTVSIICINAWTTRRHIPEEGCNLVISTGGGLSCREGADAMASSSPGRGRRMGCMVTSKWYACGQHTTDCAASSTTFLCFADQKGTPVHSHGALSTPYLVEAAHNPEVIGQDPNLCASTLLVVITELALTRSHM